MNKTVSIIYQTIDKLETIGPRRAAALNKIGIYKIIYIFYYFPRRYLDRSDIGKMATLKAGQETTVIGRVVNFELKRGKRNRFELYLTDGTSYLTCIWFSKFAYWQRIFKPGEWLALSGKIIDGLRSE